MHVSYKSSTYDWHHSSEALSTVCSTCTVLYTYSTTHHLVVVVEIVRAKVVEFELCICLDFWHWNLDVRRECRGGHTVYWWHFGHTDTGSWRRGSRIWKLLWHRRLPGVLRVRRAVMSAATTCHVLLHMLFDMSGKIMVPE